MAININLKNKKEENKKEIKQTLFDTIMNILFQNSSKVL
jgi:hypothetical protein